MEEEFNGFFYCPVCSQKAAVRGADFTAEEYGCEREGVVHTYSCAACGAEIEAYEFEDE